jgi:hypothetical protein
MSPARSFTTDYHPFHPNVSINCQLNHFRDGSPASVTELTAAAPRNTGYADFTRELLALSKAADAGWRTLAGALYQWTECYMLPDDPRKDPARHRSIESRCATCSGWMKPRRSTFLSETAISSPSRPPRLASRVLRTSHPNPGDSPERTTRHDAKPCPMLDRSAVGSSGDGFTWHDRGQDLFIGLKQWRNGSRAGLRHG